MVAYPRLHSADEDAVFLADQLWFMTRPREEEKSVITEHEKLLDASGGSRMMPTPGLQIYLWHRCHPYL